MKKVICMFSLLWLSTFLFAIASCECGDHVNGIVAYTTVGPNCCSSSPSSDGVGVYHYYDLIEGVWEHTGTAYTSSQADQAFCCGKASNNHSY